MEFKYEQYGRYDELIGRTKSGHELKGYFPLDGKVDVWFDGIPFERENTNYELIYINLDGVVISLKDVAEMLEDECRKAAARLKADEARGARDYAFLSSPVKTGRI